MTLLHRRLLTILFALIFLVITPTLFFYSSGYRINWQSKRIEHVGVLHVSTEPKYTTLILDGQEHQIEDELVLKNVRPGKHDIIVNQTGYHSWYKNLEVFPHQTTIIRDLLLFKDEPAEVYEIFTNEINIIDQVDNLSLFASNNYLFLHDGKSNQTFEYSIDDTANIENVRLYPQRSSASFSINENWYYIDSNSDEVQEITNFLPENTTGLYLTSSHLYSLTTDGIWRLNFDNKLTSTEQVSNQMFPTTMIESDDAFWFIATEPSGKHAFLYSQTGIGVNPTLITTLPHSESLRIVENYNGFLTLCDKSNSTLFLIDTNTNDNSTVTLENVNDWQWSNDHTQLLVAFEHELIIHHFGKERKQELLLRLSTNITQAHWHSLERQVFFVTDNKIMLVERDDRDHRNIYSLTEQFNDIKILSVDADDYNLNFFARISEDVGSGYYQLPLR